MIELKGLEDWAREMLATPISTLNRRFESWKKEEELRKSIEELPFFTRYRPVFRQISKPTLRELHQKLRGQKCETNFWIILPTSLNHPLPDDVALDLIERDIAVSWIGHSLQSDQVTWKLVPLVSEALLSLAARFYINSQYTLEDFEGVLRQFPDQNWMFGNLGHCSASSLEKRRAYEKAIENHPQRDTWFNTNQEINPNQQYFSYYYDLAGLPETERMQKLYGDYTSQQLLDIARDDNTPDEILHELENLPGSREVRFNARHNLRRRAENEPDLPF